jgi:hypothetical protein
MAATFNLVFRHQYKLKTYVYLGDRRIGVIKHDKDNFQNCRVTHELFCTQDFDGICQYDHYETFDDYAVKFQELVFNFIANYYADDFDVNVYFVSNVKKNCFHFRKRKSYVVKVKTNRKYDPVSKFH